MEYRGFEYTVVRTLSPPGWRWSVQRGRTEKVGISPDRKNAILRAEDFIDHLVKTLAYTKK